MPTRKEVRAAAEELSKHLSDRGQLIEAGWAIFRGMVVPSDAPDVQVSEMRLAFMAGAQHLFASIMGILDPGSEPTDRDLRRIELINNELENFAKKELELRFQRTEGQA